jgi:aryl-alcohol dehydrogenase-like predicted oxidoreductase
VERRILGKTALEVSVLVFGAAEIGYENTDAATVDRMVGSALDAGVNAIDTGECYVDSEEKIGSAVSHRREKVLLFTKCGHASGLDGEDWTSELIRRSVDRSLRRLRTDRLDLLQLHSCSAALLKRGDVIRALQDARDSGKTRYIGYSGDGVDALAAIETRAFDTLQTSINLADQEAITLTVPRALEQSMGVLAKRSLANAAWKYENKPENPYHHEYWDRLKRIDYLFLRIGRLEDSLATALRFTLSVPGVTAAITGSKSADHLRQNLRAVPPYTLPSDQFECIRTIWSDRASPTWTGQV